MIPIKRYKKGIETQNNIINASKSLFYLQGLNSTTVQKIADLASVNLGLLSYYFKTKNNIINTIFDEFFNKTYSMVESKLGKDIDAILIQMVNERVIYDIIFNDTNNFRFFKETIDKHIVLKLFEEITYINYNRINIENAFSINENLLKCYSVIECGGRLNLLKNYSNGILNVEYKDLINILASCTPRLLGVDNEVISEYIVKSKKLQDSIDYSKIKMLI